MNTPENFYFNGNERPLPMVGRTGCFDNPPCLHKPIDGDGEGEKALLYGCAWRLKGKIDQTIAPALEQENSEVEVLAEEYKCNTRGFIGKVIKKDDRVMLFNPRDNTTRPMSNAGITRGLNRDIS